ncbi:MAG: GldG family protein [Archangium sp.]|nr:GldG family protein [Archangium sp.]MDP3569101.1 GldG family protein [Archangium sp.]
MKIQHGLFLLAVIGSLVIINLMGLRFFGRLDVTRDGTFTLAGASRQTLAALDEPVTVTAYFTENLPAPYASNARYVRDLLEELRAASKGQVAFEFIDPAGQETEKDKETRREVKQDIFGRRFREPTSVEKELTSAGVQPVELRVIEDDQQQTRRAYMGLVIKHKEQKEVIPVVKSVEGLEYDLTTLIRKLARTRTPVIGVLQGHEGPSLQEKLQILQAAFAQTYELRPVELGQKDRFDGSLDALFVIGPKTALSPQEVKAVDQFLMEGKSVALFLDTLQVDLRAFNPSEANHGLTQWLGTQGVTIGDQLVADASSASINVSERRGYMLVQMPVPFPFLPVVKQLEGESPISKGLSDVIFPFVSPVSVTPLAGVQAQVLARSSNKSWLEAKPPNVDPRRDWRSESPQVSGPHPLMVQLSGQMKSAFPAEPGVLSESKGEARLIVVGTSALIQDDFAGMSRGNQALLLNVADWLLLDPALLAMRSRGLSVATLQPELSEGTRNAVKFGNTLGLPLALALLGLIRWRMREARRAAISI